MTIDVAMLEAHDSFDDAELGVSERFLRLELSSGRTVGVLSSPLGPAQPIGWVLFHSFGSEEMDLHMLEVSIARGAAAAGFPVLRFQCQGYGDSEHVEARPSLSSHLRDSIDAARQMAQLSGVREVGLIGARFGATIAAIVGEELGVGLLMLVSPVVSGAPFVRDLLRYHAMTEMVEGDGESGQEVMGSVRSLLSSGSVVNIKGFTLTKEIVEEIERVDLLKTMQGFRGRALLLQVSIAERRQASLMRLAGHIEKLGGNATVSVVTDQAAARFGRDHFYSWEGGSRDIMTGLNDAISEEVVGWSTAVAADRHGPEGVDG